MSKGNISKFNLIIILVIIAMFSISPVMAVPPSNNPTTQVSSASNLQIESPNLPYLKIGNEKRFHAHVINATSSKTNKTTSCILHVYNSTGFDLTTVPQVMEFEAYNGIDFARSVSGGNFTQTGVYAYVIQCNSSNEVGFYRGQFLVTPNGDVADVGTAVFYIGLLAVLLFFLALSIYSFAEFDNLLNRVGMLGISYLLLMAITFIGWNMAQDFLTSSPFLIDMLRILFLVLSIGALPLLIGGFIWYLIMLFKIKEIDHMMQKGIPFNEAERRVNRR